MHCVELTVSEIAKKLGLKRWDTENLLHALKKAGKASIVGHRRTPKAGRPCRVWSIPNPLYLF